MIKLKVITSMMLAFVMTRCVTELKDFVGLSIESMQEIMRNQEQVDLTNSISGEKEPCPSEWLEEIAIANGMPERNKITVLHKEKKKLYTIVMRPEFGIIVVSLNHISLMKYIFRMWGANNISNDRVVLNLEDFKEEDKQNIIEILHDWYLLGCILDTSVSADRRTIMGHMGRVFKKQDTLFLRNYGALNVACSWSKDLKKIFLTFSDTKRLMIALFKI